MYIYEQRNNQNGKQQNPSAGSQCLAPAGSVGHNKNVIWQTIGSHPTDFRFDRCVFHPGGVGDTICCANRPCWRATLVSSGRNWLFTVWVGRFLLCSHSWPKPSATFSGAVFSTLYTSLLPSLFGGILGCSSPSWASLAC
jgi:hypothetical protein